VLDRSRIGTPRQNSRPALEERARRILRSPPINAFFRRLSQNEERMASARDSGADLPRMPRRRWRIVIGAAGFGALVAISAAVTAAFVTVDRRAVQAFKAQPRIAHAGSKRILPASTTGAAAPTDSMADPLARSTALAVQAVDPADGLRKAAHHGRKKHVRRAARWRSHWPRDRLFGFFVGR
jgi:hypothetical protein